MEVCGKNKYKPTVVKDSVTFTESFGFVCMHYSVLKYYQTEFCGEPRLLSVDEMCIEYSRSDCTLEFQNNSECYGQGQTFHFSMIEIFKKHLESKGLEVL